MIHIKICDDDLIIGDKIKKLVVSELEKRGIAWECSIFTSGEELLKTEAEDKELIFLDIEMPEISGLEVGKRLKDMGRNRNTVFLTSYDQLVFLALESIPFYFMRKSKMDEEIGGVIEQYLRRYQEGKCVLLYTVRSKRYCIPGDEIRYITCSNHKMIVKLEDGDQKTFRGTIKECEAQLKGGRFFKANSGTLVNLKYCELLSSRGFVIKGETISVSREKKKEAQSEFMKYWSEGG